MQLTALSQSSLPNLPPVTHQGRRVLTTELLAAAFKVDVKIIHDGFARNEDRFEQGRHVFKVVGSDLRDLKDQPALNGLVDKRAAHLLLWTERGAAHHAKMINTDEAWAVYERLASAYFDAPAAPKPASLVDCARDVSVVFTSFFTIATTIGFDQNQAAFSANVVTRRSTGIDALQELGVTHLDAPQQAAMLTPTDIGVKLGGLSAVAVNKMLIAAGIQTEFRDGKNRPIKEPTDKGQPYAIWQDTPKKHSDGTPVRQLKWSADVVDLLRGEPAP